MDTTTVRTCSRRNRNQKVTAREALAIGGNVCVLLICYFAPPRASTHERKRVACAVDGGAHTRRAKHLILSVFNKRPAECKTLAANDLRAKYVIELSFQERGETTNRKACLSQNIICMAWVRSTPI